MEEIAAFMSRTYKQLFSFNLMPCCKYHPSCSKYAMLAVKQYGPVVGALKSVWRILRCNPFSRGGVDLP